MTDLLVPVLGMAVPVLLVVLLTLVSGRKLSGSCGGVGPDGKCSRCFSPQAAKWRSSAARIAARSSSVASS